MLENNFSMSKNLSDFFNNISESKEEVEKLFSFSNIDEMYEYAISKSEGNFSKEEFSNSLNLVMEYLKNLESKKLSNNNLVKSKELSTDDLENITGGQEESTFRSIAMIINAITSLIETILNLRYKSKSDEYQRELMKENKIINDLEREKKAYELKLHKKNLENELELLEKNKNKNKDVTQEIKNN